MNDFDYLSKTDIYLDSACQSLRPRPVIDALNSYYTTHNSCGERVKYPWGVKTDDLVLSTRHHVLKFLKLKQKDYFTSFTLNTTYGLNLLLSQLDPTGFDKVITSEIEHNSPFLSTITFAQTHHLDRIVIPRQPDGSVSPDATDFSHSITVLNCVSNVDGRRLENIKELTKHIHKKGGLLIIDAAQALGHSSSLLHKTEADAICFSAHKMYGPSLGGMVIKKSLLQHINTTFIGGGMVDDVERNSYQLSADNPDHIYTIFEPGLQAWGEIIALGAALTWLEKLPASAHQTLEDNITRLYDFLSNHPKIHLLNHSPTPTMSFYVDGLDSHLLGSALADQHIMARTGYFCVHYYLDHVKHYPPLVRFSLGYHTRPSDIDQVIAALSKI